MEIHNKYFDSHCHIDLTMSREIELDQILQGLEESGTDKVIQIASDPDSVKFSPGFCHERSGTTQFYYTIGLHPNEAHELDVDSCLDAITRNSGDIRFVAVGEIGLDFYYGREHRDLQIEVFRRYLEAAVVSNRPVVIHTRNAHEDTLAILSDSGVKKILIHCFTGTKEQMKDFLDLGAYISFSGIVTFKNAAEVQEAARLCPRDRIMIETDSPYLAPVPYRGQVNVPAYIREVGGFISRLRGEDLTADFYKNSSDFFLK